MPAQVSVLADFNAAETADLSAHSHDPLRTGFSALPPGITNGVAKLIKCRFEKIGPDTNRKKMDGSSAAGEAQFVLVGIVMEPLEIINPKTGQKVRVAGQQFRPIPIPIYDMDSDKKSKKSQALKSMEAMKLIANKVDLFPKQVTAQVLESYSLALEKRSNGTPDTPAKPIYFRFSTEAADEGDMVFQNVRAWPAYDAPPDQYVPPGPTAQTAVQDNPAARQAQAFTPAPQQAPPTQMADPLAQAPAPAVDIAKLAALADGDTRLQELRNAQVELMRIWKASGQGEQSFKDANKYADVGMVLLGQAIVPQYAPGTAWSAFAGSTHAPAPLAASPPESHVNGTPKKDDVWKYKFKYSDPVTDEIKEALIDTIVTAVNADGTFYLTDMKTKTKSFKARKEDLVAVG